MIKNITIVSSMALGTLSAISVDQVSASRAGDDAEYWTEVTPKTGSNQTVNDEEGDEEVVLIMNDTGAKIRNTAPRARAAAAPAAVKKTDNQLKITGKNEHVRIEVECLDFSEISPRTAAPAPATEPVSAPAPIEEEDSSDFECEAVNMDSNLDPRWSTFQDTYVVPGRIHAALAWEREAFGEESHREDEPRQSSQASNEVPKQNSEKSNWTESFILDNGLEARHTPDRVSVGNLSGAIVVTLGAGSFNGMTIKAPLTVRPDMSREEFLAALIKSGLIKE